MSLRQYQIINRIGSGSLGIVHKARHRRTGQLCVLKQIDMSKMDYRTKRWAMNEAQLMKSINCKYIVKFTASFIEKSSIFIVMEYCPKGDLSTFIRAQMGKPIKEDIIWKLSLQIIIGLRELHSNKILHRDIKTMNIFLDQHGNARIGDLGVAKTMKEDFTRTIVGTPYYLSPQMCEEKPYNQKTDIWAMGCLIYQLATGKHPFQANNQAALALKIVMGKYAPISQHYSKELEWVIRSCLAVDYKRRPSCEFLLQQEKIIQKAQQLNISLQDSCWEEHKEIEKLPEQEKEVNVQRSSKGFTKVDNNLGQKRKSKDKGSPNDKQLLEQARNKMIKQQKPVTKGEPIKQQSKNVSNAALPKRNSSKSIEASKKSVDKKSNQSKKQENNQIFKVVTPKVELVSKKRSNPKANYASVPTESPLHYPPVIKMQPKEQLIIQQQKKPDIFVKEEGISKPASTKMNKLAIISQVQKQVDDDELMEEFGITPEKLNTVNAQGFQLNNARTINWEQQLQVSTYKTVDPNINLDATAFRYLPTVRTNSNTEAVSIIQGREQTQDDYIEQDLNDNLPFKEQSMQEQPSLFENSNVLVEEFETEIEEDLTLKSQQEQERLFHKIEENQKRRKQLLLKKEHHESQLLSEISLEEYDKLKQAVRSGSDQEVERILLKRMKNSNGYAPFYKIFHFDLQIDRCNNNIETMRDKLQKYMQSNQ